MDESGFDCWRRGDVRASWPWAWVAGIGAEGLSCISTEFVVAVVVAVAAAASFRITPGSKVLSASPSLSNMSKETDSERV